MPPDLSTTYPDTEISRIRAAYARRTDHDRYQWSNPAHVFAVQERERHTLALLRSYGFSALGEVRILELGCGVGFWLREFVKWGAQPVNITGVDLLADRVAEAQRLCPAGVTLTCGDASTVELPVNDFQIVLQSMLFSSVLDQELRRALARKMLASVRHDGLILWHDFQVNNPSNPDVRGVPRAEIEKLFPNCLIDLRRVTLAPPLARAVAPTAPLLYGLLQRMGMLRTHFLGVIRKR
jgi:SAM-dependent methyltransferase